MTAAVDHVAQADGQLMTSGAMFEKEEASLSESFDPDERARISSDGLTDSEAIKHIGLSIAAAASRPYRVRVRAMTIIGVLLALMSIHVDNHERSSSNRRCASGR